MTATAWVSRSSARRASRPTRLKGLQRDQVRGSRCSASGIVGDGRLFAREDGRGQWIAGRLGCGQNAIDDQELLSEADGSEFVMGARHFAQGRPLSARDQDQSRAARIGQRLDRRPILHPLLFETGQRPEARGIALARVEEPGPGPWQLQQPYGVPGGCRVENDVIVRPR